MIETSKNKKISIESYINMFLKYDTIDEDLFIMKIKNALNKGEINPIKRNLKKILEKTNQTYIYAYNFKKYKQLSDEVNKYIDANKEEYVESLIDYVLYNFYRDYTNCKEQKLTTPFKLLIEQIAANEQVNFHDIKEISYGGYSYIFQIGEKVLKIGSDRYTNTFPNNPYIIAPLLRRGIKDIKCNSNILFIELCQVAIPDKSFDEEKAYELYKGLRDLGIAWNDINFKNIGTLKKDNIIHWHEELNPSDESLQLQPKRGNFILKKGDKAILDGDFLHDQDSIIIENDYLVEFEERYQSERPKSKRLKIRYEL